MQPLPTFFTIWGTLIAAKAVLVLADFDTWALNPVQQAGVLVVLAAASFFGAWLTTEER